MTFFRVTALPCFPAVYRFYCVLPRCGLQLYCFVISRSRVTALPPSCLVAVFYRALPFFCPVLSRYRVLPCFVPRFAALPLIEGRNERYMFKGSEKKAKQCRHFLVGIRFCVIVHVVGWLVVVVLVLVLVLCCVVLCCIALSRFGLVLGWVGLR